ncbi:MAG TPA: hypothetical protein VE522_06520, partial [Actinomycetota bacterium]|nr:hypothetical protein [Actinomycetota bacterium]
MYSRSLVAVAALTAALLLTPGASAETSVKDYVVPVGSAYEVDAVLSVGDDMPQTGEDGDFYQMIGIPDGL